MKRLRIIEQNSIKADAGIFARAVRGHWGVKNRLHWCLDVTFSPYLSKSSSKAWLKA